MLMNQIWLFWRQILVEILSGHTYGAQPLPLAFLKNARKGRKFTCKKHPTLHSF